MWALQKILSTIPFLSQIVHRGRVTRSLNSHNSSHVTLEKHFMQKGARCCPGSRVAQNEMLAMIVQVVLDWKISFADGRMSTYIKYDSSPN